MTGTILRGRTISPGTASGEVLVSREPISFLGGVDPMTGIIIDKTNSACGKSIAGKVFVFPRGKGSTVGTYVLFQLKKNGVAPAAIVNESSEAIVAVGAIISGIPMLDLLEAGAYAKLKDGMRVSVNASADAMGTIEEVWVAGQGI